jgi:hypothetical protein
LRLLLSHAAHTHGDLMLMISKRGGANRQKQILLDQCKPIKGTSKLLYHYYWDS